MDKFKPRGFLEVIKLYEDGLFTKEINFNLK